jgi:nucleoid-associated protein YgaU
MQRDVKVGIAIGVLIIALVAVFWWAQKDEDDITIVRRGQRSGEDGDTLAAPSQRSPIEQYRDLEPTDMPSADARVVDGVEQGPAVPLPVDDEETGRIALTETDAAPGTGGEPPSDRATAPPAPPSAPAGAPPAAGATREYVVKSGESLSTIAKKHYGTESRWKEIWKANRDVLPDPNVVREGMRLKIPGADAAAQPPPDATVRDAGTSEASVHSVKKAETLFGIAQRYYGDGGKWRRILEANRELLDDENALRPGMKLTIPPAP